jgi:hypothetical protein
MTVLLLGGTIAGRGVCLEHAESVTKHCTSELLPQPLSPSTTMFTDVRSICNCKRNDAAPCARTLLNKARAAMNCGL